MSVTIFFDPYRMSGSPDLLRVDTQHDFIDACRRIDSALREGDTLAIALHNPAMQGWFDHYKGRASVTFQHCDPCQSLAESLGAKLFDLPVEMREDPLSVLSESLIGKAQRRPRRDGETVLAWVLSNTLGGVWAAENLEDPSQLAALLSELAGNKSATSIAPTILSLRDRRVNSWRSSTKYGRLVDWLFAAPPKKRAASLLLARLLWNYPPEVVRKALQFDNRWAELSLIADLDDLVLAIPLEACLVCDLPSAVAQVTREFLNDQLSDGLLSPALKHISGYMPEEARVIRTFLDKNSEHIDETWGADLAALAECFSASGEHSGLVRFVETLTPQTTPPHLDRAADWSSARDWLLSRYFPYLAWCSARNKLEETEQAARAFEDWLLSSYDALTRANGFAPFAIRELLQRSSHSAPVLLVIVDGMPWHYAHELRSHLGRHGVRNVRVNAHMTALPSITRVSKPSLVRGQTPNQIAADDASVDYTGLLAMSLCMDEPDIAYGVSLDKTVTELVREQRRAYLYLFNDIDQEVHRPWSRSRRDDQIGKLLDNLADDISVALQEYAVQFGRALDVFIASDHGFTELTRHSKQVVLPNSEDHSVCHSRVVLDFDPQASVPEGLARIDGCKIGSKSDVLVARGYDYVGSRPRGACHGGLTPQEVVVPILSLTSAQELTYQDVSVAVTGEVRRGRRLNPVKFAIVNNNAVAVTVRGVRARLLSVDDSLPLVVEPNQGIELSAQIDGSNLRQKYFKLAGMLHVDFLDGVVDTQIAYDLETTGAALADQSFEDDFIV